MNVNAYAAPSADRAARPHHHRAPGGRRQRRPDRDHARRHLPLRHPHRPRRLGPAALPVVPGHEIVGIVTEVGPDVTSHQVGDRVGVGCMVNSCGECANCRAATSSTASTAWSPPTAASTATAPSPRAATPPTSSSTPTSCSACPRASTSPPPRRCCAPASPPTRRCATGAPARQEGRRRRPRRARATWPSRSPHAMGAEVTVLSQSLKKQEDGLRLGADHYYATSDPDTFTHAGRQLRPDHQHRQRVDRRRRLPVAAGPGRRTGQRRRPRRAAEPQRRSPSSAAAAPSPAR